MSKKSYESRRSPKKIVIKKVTLFNPNSSPTPSPIKKVRKLCSDIYEVTQTEDFTEIRFDLPINLDRGRLDEKVCQSTEDTSFKTPTITFLPKRPKKFCP